MRIRNYKLCVRLNEDELDIIKRRIQKTGYSGEAYIRSVLLGSIPKEKPDKHFFSVMRDLNSIANNVNQIARKAAAFGSVNAQVFQKEAEKWNRFQLDVRQKFLMPEKSE